MLPKGMVNCLPINTFWQTTGNSMNGGKHPILDGDMLLLELITPESAGSL